MFREDDPGADAQPYNAKIEPAGLWIEVNLPSLVETIHISPAAEPWLVTTIQEVTAEHDLDVPVLQSPLRGSLLY